ncbi:MAG: hypothetical protein JNJ83_21290 [Verrucomicrobiaceae bacterium]|nr:hypothetical protein [Verrucomicrobiaceae bacterium]
MNRSELDRANWITRASFHRGRVEPFAQAFLDRRSRHQRHPVHDFLFTYYPFPPGKLVRWVPALGEKEPFTVELDEALPWLRDLPHQFGDGCFQLDGAQISPATFRAGAFIQSLCLGILGRPPRFSCFGLHEWAMVYRQTPDEVRHQGWNLRLPVNELAAFVESQLVCCTHFDAFRFFTAEARPLNTFQPTLESRLELEQSGCLHANMDLYKWAGKLWPWAGAELLADAFELATAGRELDMRASPYDLEALGYEPIRIETPEGREHYRQEQQALQERSVPVRNKLLAAANLILSYQSHESTPAVP